MDKWEYCRSRNCTDQELNELGQQGWELAAYLPTVCCGVFKRKIPSSPTQQVQSQRSPRQEDDFDISF